MTVLGLLFGGFIWWLVWGRDRVAWDDAIEIVRGDAELRQQVCGRTTSDLGKVSIEERHTTSVPDMDRTQASGVLMAHPMDGSECRAPIQFKYQRMRTITNGSGTGSWLMLVDVQVGHYPPVDLVARRSAR